MGSASNSVSPGTVSIFGTYKNGVIDKFQDIKVGAEPGMIKFTNDCRTLLVANEGSAAESDDGTNVIDPEGSITILRFPGNDLSQTPNKITVNFNEFDSRSSEYESKGVRIPYKGSLGTGSSASTFSQSMEPEYITLNSDESLAYVTLQENNAIAVVNIGQGEVTEIYPLGQKDWSQLLFDSSDTDSEINLRSWPVSSLYQPDVVIYFKLNGEGYLAMVNEGKMLDYETSNGETWTESARGSEIISDNLLADNVSSNLQQALSDNNKLGRLQFSKVDGLNDLGKIEKLHFYGGRGWSIMRVKDMSQVYDSGDELERKHAEFLETVFNAESTPDSEMQTPSQLKDQKSDDLGPECESLAIGDVDGKKLFFIGVEGPSSIVTYSMGSSLQPQFESIYRAGGVNASFKSIYESRTSGDLEPEDLRFIQSDDSPTGKPLLLVTGTASGTVSLYEIVNEGNGGASTTQTSVWLIFMIMAANSIGIQMQRL
ncbi:mesenchyme-specific cell surface glycoprotein-like [Anneissia japonica]|uniref:mesenchyme-specific cell surface glycoprotein-like n=1 Tax=Anneissia japonica TaxID=1529436 RepID=UPI00142564B0|nr:mesenchyme-specific cell surface glycoprotein-like [Anneissia japonica]